MRKVKTKIRVKLSFEPRDMWIGLYWNTWKIGTIHGYALYFCIVPMLPIKVYISRARWKHD